MPHAARTLMQAVAELHARGLERIRLAAYLAPSGAYWRYAVVPDSYVRPDHGATDDTPGVVSAEGFGDAERSRARLHSSLISLRRSRSSSFDAPISNSTDPRWSVSDVSTPSPSSRSASNS